MTVIAVEQLIYARRMTEPAPPTTPRFAERLAALEQRRQSQIVLGLETDPARLWPAAIETAPRAGTAAERAAAAVVAHCRAAIDAVGESCVAIKPQLACFERLGAPGWAALAATVTYAHEQGLLVLADGKRGDVDVSAAAYGQALVGTTATPFGTVDGLGADAMTVNPYMGADTLGVLAGAATQARAGIFVLVRTSNPGAQDVEDLLTSAGTTVWEEVAALTAALGGDGPGLSDIGAVVGATMPEHIARLRELMPRAVFLLPGVGAQGGRVEDLAPAFAPGPAGGLVTASRSLVFAAAETGGDPAAAARTEAERLRAAAWALA